MCCCVLYNHHNCILRFFFFFKQKTAYEMRISDWSSDVCSSDLTRPPLLPMDYVYITHRLRLPLAPLVFFEKSAHFQGQAQCAAYNNDKIGRASCRERVCQYV